MNYNEFNHKNKQYNSLFFIIVFYLIIDILRPQSFIPIGVLRPGLIITFLLIFTLFLSGKILSIIEYKQVKYIFAFVILLFFHVPFAVNNFYAFQTALDMLIILPFLFSIIVAINTKRRIISLFKVYAALLTFLSCYSLVNSGRGPGGTVGDENDLCLFIVSFLPIVIFLINNTKNYFGKFYFILTVGLCLLAIVATFSRGGFLGLAAMVFVYWLFSKKKFIYFIFCLIFGFFIFISGGENYRNEMSTITDTNETTAVSRILTWKSGLEMFIDNPMGVGGGNFPIRFPEYQSDQMPRNMWGRVAHSLWITLITETGIFGLYIYLIILLHNFKNIFAMRFSDCNSKASLFYTQLSTSLLASLAGFLTSATFLSVLYYPPFWMLTAIIIATKSLFLQEQLCS